MARDTVGSKLQAIPTRYAGCRFRSRIEARWAVFFDAMNYEWQYEPQGYRLKSGNYLPDFLLPDFCYLEIKGVPVESGSRDEKRLLEFGGRTALPLFVLEGGIPERCLRDGVVGKLRGRSASCVVSQQLVKCKWFVGYADVIDAALSAARGARFEFGESGGS